MNFGLKKRKVMVTIKGNNKRYKEAIDINAENKERAEKKNEAILFGLALIFGLVINLLANYIDRWVVNYFPIIYVYFQLFIVVIASVILIIIARIIIKYIQLENQYGEKLYEISKLNPETKYFKLGEWARGEEWEYRVSKIFDKYVIKAKRSTYRASGKFTVIELDLKNLKKETSHFLWLNVQLKDDKDIYYEYDEHSLFLNESFPEKLIPNKNYRIYIPFDMPRTSKAKVLYFKKELYEIALM
jgi:hypothetical protein